jgi:putative membrane protein
VDRTRLAHERTLMAWVRTAISLITFGFSFYKFFQFERGDAPRRSNSLVSVSDFAMLLVAIGLLSLLMAALEHRRDLNALKAEFGDVPMSLALVLAGVIFALGLLLLVAIMLRR